MSILSNNFATPITFDNIFKMCADKPYEFCEEIYPHNLYKKHDKFIGTTSRVYYLESDDKYYDMSFFLYEDKLIVTKYIYRPLRREVIQEYPVDCAETVIMLMDDYFTKYKFLTGLYEFDEQNMTNN